MLTYLTLLPLASLLATSTPAPSTGIVRPAADTGSATTAAAPAPLTDGLLTHYIAVKKDLGTFWKDSAHQTLYNDAKAHHHTPSVTIGQQSLQIGVFDYPALVKQNADLAALFKKNQFDPAQFEPVQVAAFTAAGALLTNQKLDANSVAGKNVALVKTHQQDLASVGVALQQQGGMGGGMGGGDDDLNP